MASFDRLRRADKVVRVLLVVHLHSCLLIVRCDVITRMLIGAALIQDVLSDRLHYVPAASLGFVSPFAFRGRVPPSMFSRTRREGRTRFGAKD